MSGNGQTISSPRGFLRSYLGLRRKPSVVPSHPFGSFQILRNVNRQWPRIDIAFQHLKLLPGLYKERAVT